MSTVRLVAGVGPPEALAVGLGGGSEGPAMEGTEVARRRSAPDIHSAHCDGAQGDNILIGKNGAGDLPVDSRPALLVSYYYLDGFLRERARYRYRDWALDSGAFSAHNSGVTISLDDYIAKAKELLAGDPTLSEVFSLDVIGDWKASAANCEAMWKAGIPAIPCYHSGEPEEVLVEMARCYPKIALGGVARKPGRFKMRFAQQAFARVWPKEVHGFGYGTEEAVMTLPFHSVDASNWELGPCAFGRWAAFGKMSVRGSKQNLRAEVEHYLRIERKARKRWTAEMSVLGAQRERTGAASPVLRLAVCSTGRETGSLQ